MNPLGVAAGMDKNGEALPAWESIGFGFCEIGGVTLHDQPGNPKPRMFRANFEKALVNRMGFNNLGAREVSQNLKIWKERGLWPGSPVGINLGKSKITALDDAPEDYAGSLELLWNYADFFVINVSSPNTPELRNLQSISFLKKILKTLITENTTGERKPILVKVSPDLSNRQLADVVRLLMELNIDGIICSNTTVARENLKSDKLKNESGGLSGKPLSKRSTEMVKLIKNQAGDKLPIVAVGGIMTPDDVVEKINAGASLVQIYTGWIYYGPTLVYDINKRLLKEYFKN